MQFLMLQKRVVVFIPLNTGLTVLAHGGFLGLVFVFRTVHDMPPLGN